MVAFDYCPLPPPPPTKTWEKSAIQKRGRGKEEGAWGGRVVFCDSSFFNRERERCYEFSMGDISSYGPVVVHGILKMRGESEILANI